MSRVKIFFISLILFSILSKGNSNLSFFIDNSGSMKNYNVEGPFTVIFEKLEAILSTHKDFPKIDIIFFGEKITPADPTFFPHLGCIIQKGDAEGFRYSEKKTKLSLIPDYILKNNLGFSIILTDAEADETSTSSLCSTGYDLTCFFLEIKKLLEKNYNLCVFGFKSPYKGNFLYPPSDEKIKLDKEIYKGLYFFIFYKNEYENYVNILYEETRNIVNASNIEHIWLYLHPFIFPKIEYCSIEILKKPQEKTKPKEKVEDIITKKSKYFDRFFIPSKKEEKDFKIVNEKVKLNVQKFILKKSSSEIDKAILQIEISQKFPYKWKENSFFNLNFETNYELYDVKQGNLSEKDPCKLNLQTIKEDKLFLVSECNGRLANKSFIGSGKLLSINIKIKPEQNLNLMKKMFANWHADNVNTEEYKNGGTLKFADLINLIYKHSTENLFLKDKLYLLLSK